MDLVEVMERTDIVLELVLQGVPRKQVVQFCQKKWGISERQSDKYLEKARALIKEAAEIDRKEEIGKALSRYERIYNKLWNMRDFKEARNTQKEITELLGIKNFNIKMIAIDSKDLPEDEKRRILRELNILKEG